MITTPPTRPLRFHLLVLIAGFMLPTVLAAALAIQYIATQKQEQFELSLREATRALSQVVEQELSRREAIAHTLAALPTLTKGDLAAFHQYATQIAPTPDRVVVLSDPSGQQLVNTRRPFGTPLPRNIDAPQGAVSVSNLYYAPLGRQHSFAVHVPVVRDGRTLYTVSYASYASLLQSLFDRQPLPQGWVASILDGAGTVVARNREPERFIGKPVSERLRARMASQDEGIFESVAVDGRPILASFHRERTYGWSIALGVPLSDFAATTRAAAAFAVYAAAALAAAVAAALWLGRRVVRPVNQLSRDAQALGRGEPVARQATGLTELDVISGMLADASVQLHASQQAMASRVQAALADAEKAQRLVVQNQRLEALGQLTGGVAHDFNNLLMIVSNYAHLLRRSSPELAAHPHLAGIERAVATGSRLTRQLLAFARRQPVRPEVIDVAERLPGLAGLIKASVGSAVRVDCSVSPGVGRVLVDPAELELAVINLAVNSRDAMPAGGDLRLRAEQASLPDGRPAVAIVVTDTGSGMPPEVLRRVFEPFFTTKEVGRGTGLGLSQVHGMAEQAGGQVGVESTPGAGTTVRIVLPVAPAAEGEGLAGPGGTPRAQPVRGARVLLVEDNLALAGPTEEVLRSAGCEVVHAGSAQQALALLGAGGCDLVLSDVRMPGELDGIGLARHLRHARPGLPVVLMTGYTAELAQAQALDVPVLAKPAGADTLLEAVAAALDASRQASAATGT